MIRHRIKTNKHTRAGETLPHRTNSGGARGEAIYKQQREASENVRGVGIVVCMLPQQRARDRKGRPSIEYGRDRYRETERNEVRYEIYLRDSTVRTREHKHNREGRRERNRGPEYRTVGGSGGDTFQHEMESFLL